jgi:hypothetical protein
VQLDGVRQALVPGSVSSPVRGLSREYLSLRACRAARSRLAWCFSDAVDVDEARRERPDGRIHHTVFAANAAADQSRRVAQTFSVALLRLFSRRAAIGRRLVAPSLHGNAGGRSGLCVYVAQTHTT